MEAFIERHGLDGVVNIADVEGDVWSRFGITGQPAWVHVTADGQISSRFGALGTQGVLQVFADGGFA